MPRRIIKNDVDEALSYHTEDIVGLSVAPARIDTMRKAALLEIYRPL